MKCWRIKNKIFKLILFSNFLFGYFIQNELIAYELITEYNHEIKLSKTRNNQNEEIIDNINLLLKDTLEKSSKESAQKALKILEKNDPKKLLVNQYNQVFIALGFIEIQNKNYKLAEKYFEKAYRIIENENISNDIRLLESLYFLGEAYQMQRLFEKSENVLNRFIEISEKRYGPNSAYLLPAMKSLIITYRANNKFIEAESTINRSIEISEKLKENRVPNLLDFKKRQILNYMRWLKYDRAEEELIRALKISENFYGNKSFKNLSFLNMFADIKTKQREDLKAKVYADQALEISKTNKNSIQYLESLKNLGFIHSQLENINLSETFFLKFKNHYEKYPEIKGITSIGNNKESMYGQALSGLGRLYIRKGEFNKAEAFLKKALTIHENNKAKGNYAQTLVDLGSLYSSQGTKNRGKEYFLRALKIDEELFGKSDLRLYYTLNELGLSYLALFENKKAEETFLRNLDIIKKHFSKDNSRYGETLNNLASVYYREGNLSKVEEIFKERIKIEQGKYGPSHSSLATYKYNLSTIYYEQKKYKESKFYALDALKSYQEKYGKYNKILVNPLYLLSKLAFHNDNLSEANNFYQRAFNIALMNFQKEAPLLIEKDRFDYNLNFEDGYFIYSLASEEESLLKSAFLRRLNRNGLIENIEKSQTYFFNNNIIDQDLNKNYRNLINEISNINLSKGKSISLEKKKNKLREGIYKKLPKTKPNILKIDHLSRNLNVNELIIEFIRIAPFNKFTNRYDLENRKYIALTLNSKNQIKIFDIGSAKVLEEKISQFIFDIQSAKEESEEKLEKVSNLIFNENFKNYLENYSSIFISADWALQRIPFFALRNNSTNKYLSEEVSMTILASSRDLLKDKLTNYDLSEPITIANPDFNLFYKNENKTNKTKPMRANKLRSKNLLSKKWESNIGFEIEGNGIHSIIGGNLITQKVATTDYVKKLISPKVLHIASHGFYFQYEGDEKNPLKRSGIVLAGANNSNENSTDDGYLTALEFINMNLKGTELVVISACESGIGDLRFNEGLNGLRRAISVSGAKSSLLSLWKVDDDATTEFMIDFYKNLKKGMYKNKALFTTQKKFRDGIIKSKFGDDWKNIFYWGAFQISGDMSPIQFEN